MMTLRAFSKVHGNPIDFDLSDCPIRMSSSLLALAGRPNSPLFREDTLVRGDSETGMFEGDEVYGENDKLLGYVVYAKGFKLQTLSNELKTLNLASHIKLNQGNKETVKLVVDNPERTPMLFYYGSRLVNISNFMCRLDNKIILVGANFNFESVCAEDLDYITGFVDETGKDVVFNGLFKGGVVTLENGRPAIKQGTEIKYLEDF